MSSVPFISAENLSKSLHLLGCVEIHRIMGTDGCLHSFWRASSGLAFNIISTKITSDSEVLYDAKLLKTILDRVIKSNNEPFMPTPFPWRVKESEAIGQDDSADHRQRH